MSLINVRGEKIPLPRQGLDEFWSVVREEYENADDVKWKHLAMFALRETAEWPLELIARVFGHSRGHVSRCIGSTREELRERFRPTFRDSQIGFSDPDLDAESERGPVWKS